MGNEHKLPYTAAEIEERLRMAGDAVLCTAQDLPPERQAKARANIGAAAVETITKTFENGDTATVKDVSSLVLHGKDVLLGGKNLCSLGSVTFTGVTDFEIAEIPAGTYSVSLLATTTDTDDTGHRVTIVFLDASGKSVSTIAFGADTGNREARTAIAFSSSAVAVRCYAASGWNDSQGDTATFSDIQVEVGSSATSYEPYGSAITGIDANVSFGDIAFSADAELFAGDSLDFADGMLRRNDGASSMIEVSGDVSSLNGTYLVAAPGAVSVTHVHDPYLKYEPQTLSQQQQAQARENFSAAGTAPIISKNLFNKAAVSEKGQMVNYANGNREFYPNNQYIANHYTSENIPVLGGRTYTWSGNSWQGEGSHFLSSYVIFASDGRYLSGFNANSNKETPYIIETPADAAYIVINFSGYDTPDTAQLELGDEATAYAPYGVVGKRLAEIKIPQEFISYDSTNLLKLPKQYNLVVGDTFELFYKGVMLCKDPYAYNILVTCDIGNAYQRKYVANPTEAGEHTLTIQVTDDFGNVIDVQSTQLVVSEKMASPASNINVLCFGDSLTAGGYWVDEVYRRLTKTTDKTQTNTPAPVGDGLSNITFVGKKTTPNGAGYEGIGGWRYGHYLDANNAENPFAYNGQVDFAAYCADLGIDKIDRCYILLGWNMAGYTEAAWKADAKALLDLLIAHNPAIKIVLMGMNLPAYDGLGTNYGATGVYANYRGLQEYVFRVDKWNKGFSVEYPDNISSINISGQFDTENNMPTTKTTPNVRNAEEIVQQNNGLHPATFGYYQIADAAYRKFTADHASV